MDSRLPTRRLALLAVLAVGVTGGTADAAKVRDFGDAPDGHPAGTAPGDAPYDGHFPSRRRSDGARHSAAGKVRLGREVDKERESVQVDRDGQDDGLRSSLVRCRRSSMFFRVNTKRLPRRLLTKRHKVYLNAWFDWNSDGDWRDVARCSRGKKGKVPEWRVQNRPVSLARFRNRRVRTIAVTVRGGPQVPGGDRGPGSRVTSMWHRASITLDEKFRARISRGRNAAASRRALNDGRGSFRHGETEDYATVPEETADCDQGVTTHDKPVNVLFFFGGPQPKKIELLKGPFDVQDFGDLVAFDAATGKMSHIGFFVVPHDDPRDPVVQVVSATYRFTLRSGATVERECLVTITHEVGAFGGGGDPGGEGDGTGGGDGDTEPDASKREGPFELTGCVPGASYFFDLYIPVDARAESHELLVPDAETRASRPLCPGMTEEDTVEMYGEGDTAPGGGPPPSGRKTYRVTIALVGGTATGEPKPFDIRVSWTNP